MGWLDDLGKQATEALPAARKPAAAKPARKPKPQVHQAQVQLRGATTNDPGQVECAYYTVTDGTVRLTNAKGVETGVAAPIGENETARQVAGRLKLSKMREKQNDFNRQIIYERAGVV